MSELIPTRYKEKLPKKWSYPLGAEIISKELKDSNLTIEIDLSFSWRGEYWHSIFQQNVKELKEILIFECHDSYFHDGLAIYVYAVPGRMKSAVRNALLSDILPKFLGWLSDENKGKKFVAHLNLKDSKLNIR